LPPYLKNFYFYLIKRSILNELSLTNRHLLIINGHGSHVTLEAIERAKDIGLDMITLPFHTSHALQPLDVYCFKPFKTIVKKVRDATMYKSNH
jgi:hypothetical protein